MTYTFPPAPYQSQVHVPEHDFPSYHLVMGYRR